MKDTPSSRNVPSIVLVSGGLDSCVALAWAHKHLGPDILPISFAYGQRHAREVAAAERICEHYHLRTPRYINLAQAFTMIGGSSLTSGLRGDNPSTEAVQRTPSDLPPTFVPGRNIIMLSVAAAIGYVEGRFDLVGGWNAVDYSGYPDCRPSFLTAMEKAINAGMDAQFLVHAPLVHSTKAAIVVDGMTLEAPLHLTWSCYTGGTVPCGICDSCKIRVEGFKAAGYPDPALS